MALPLLGRNGKKRDHYVSIDLGGRTTKAVQLQRDGERLVLSRYALLDAPIYEKNLSPELLAEHLKQVCQALEAKTRIVTLAIGVSDAVVRHADLPAMPVDDMRQVLKNNSKNYLQQDLPGHVFDCYVIPPRPAKAGDKPKSAASNGKQRVLVAGAKKQLIDGIQAALKAAGLTALEIVPGLIGPVNAFQMTMPDIFSREVLALVDIGFKNSTICILQEGELVMSRVVGIGGDHLTNGLAESLGISYAEAESIKMGMPAEVQAVLESLIMPLGRELRASIDFFEHQQDRPVAEVFVNGGSARSEFITKTLQTDLLVECKPWNPLSFLQSSLPPQLTAELDHVAPQLTVAVGAAVSAFSS